MRQDAVKSAKARNDLAQSELEAAKASKQAAIENGVTSERDLELWDKEIQKLQERADSTKEELLEDLHAVLQGAADQFKETIPKYMVKHQVKPGLTGWAQIHGCRGDTSINKRIEYDIEYVENWHMGLDLAIMIKTALKKNPNAY